MLRLGNNYIITEHIVIFHIVFCAAINMSTLCVMPRLLKSLLTKMDSCFMLEDYRPNLSSAEEAQIKL